MSVQGDLDAIARMAADETPEEVERWPRGAEDF
jgi:hypothetical protein